MFEYVELLWLALCYIWRSHVARSEIRSMKDRKFMSWRVLDPKSDVAGGKPRGKRLVHFQGKPVRIFQRFGSSKRTLMS